MDNFFDPVFATAQKSYRKEWDRRYRTETTVKVAALVLSSSWIHSSLSLSFSYLIFGFLLPFPSLPLDWNFLQVFADSTWVEGNTKRFLFDHGHFICQVQWRYRDWLHSCWKIHTIRIMIQWVIWYRMFHLHPICLYLTLSLQMDSPTGVWQVALWRMRTHSWASVMASLSQVYFTSINITSLLEIPDTHSFNSPK